LAAPIDGGRRLYRAWRVRTTLEPRGPSGANQLTGIVHGAFQQSLESLRRFVEDNIPWDAS
jgi:hypothetical protein